MPLDRYRVALSPAEITKRAHDLARTMVELAHTEEQKAEAAKEYSETIKELRERAHELAHEVHSGTEERLVEVDYRRNLESGMLDTVVVGTGEVIRSRELTEAERQVTIDDLRDQREQRAAEAADRLVAVGDVTIENTGAASPLADAVVEGVRAANERKAARSDEPHEPVDVGDRDELEPEMVEID